MDETPPLWGRNLAAAREAAGLTQKDLAEKLNVNWSTISRWEGGRMEPRLEPALRIAALLGVPVTELFPVDEQVA